MAINSKKISGFRELSKLDGDEYLMVAFNNRSYKVRTSLFTSDTIKSIKQTVKTGDGEASNIVIETNDGNTNTFTVRNGFRGQTGYTGNVGGKGETGNAGIALYNTSLDDRIIDAVDGTDGNGVILSDDTLTTYALSARQGAGLNNMLVQLAEEYLTQDEYDELVASNGVKSNVKYFILEEE